MRFLQLLLVASLVSIGIGVAFCLSTASVEAELPKLDFEPPAEPSHGEEGVGPKAAVADRVVVTGTREKSALVTDDDVAAAAVDPTRDDSERHVVTLRGRVIDAESGAPLEGVTVRSEEVVVAAPTRTDRDGAFTLEGTTAVTTWVPVVATHAGFVSILRKCDVAVCGEVEFEFPLRRGCLVVGRVELPPKIVASDIELTVSYEDADDGEEDHPDVGNVRPDGSFVIDSVLPGAIVVLRARVGDHARGVTLPIRVPPVAGSIVHADVPLFVRASCTIRLHSGDERPGERGDDASFDPEDGVGLVRLDRGEEFRGGSGPEEDRSYRFSDIPAGRYAVILNSWLIGAGGVPLGTIELGPGEDRTIDLRKPPSLRVAGRFVPAQKIGLDRGCRPPAPVVLTLARPGTTLQGIVVGRDEVAFFFPSVPPGRYALTASVDTEPLEVEAGDTAVVVREIGRGIVAGSVDVEPDARPVVVLTRANGVTTTAACRPPESSRGAPSCEFEFEECGPGPLRLEVVAAGHRLLERTIGAPRGMERLELGTLRLEREDDQVGTVVDEHDQPLAGVVVRAIRALPHTGLDYVREFAAIWSSSFTSDDAGRFTFPFEPRLAGFDIVLRDGESARVAAVSDGGRFLLRWPRLRAIRMTVVTEQGQPASDVCVRLIRSTDDLFDGGCIGDATTDDFGCCGILTRERGLFELRQSTTSLDLELDVEPFMLRDAELDIGTLVLRH